MPEIRFEAPIEDVAILDGYCSAAGRCRTEVIKEILAAWSAGKLREAETILRVARSASAGFHSDVTPARSESDRNGGGK